jgi:hypothetical protein
MPRSTEGQIGIQLPWKQVLGVGLLVESFQFLGSRMVDGEIKRILSGVIPAGMATVQLLSQEHAVRAAQLAKTSEDFFLLSLPVKHDNDLRVFDWVFNKRGVAEGEEVWATYAPRPFLPSRGACLFVEIHRKGTYRQIFDARQRGEEEPSIEPIWLHHPTQPLHAS